MATEFCPECHQPLSNVVEGVRLTKFKAKLFKFIASHPGQSSAEIGSQFYDKGLDPGQAIRSHIHQINLRLEDTEVQIRGGCFAGYHVIHRAQR